MNTVISPSELIGEEVALLKTDPNTGVPVSESGEWLKAGEERYIRFQSEAAAREFAADCLKENPLLEWSLIDASGKQLGTLHDKESLVRAAKSKTMKRGFWSRWFG
jgi:hypothetical protein